MNYDVQITFSRAGNSITVPYNPETLSAAIGGTNEVVEVVGTGEVSILRKPKLRTIPFNIWVDDFDIVQFFIDCQKAQSTMRMVVTDLDFKPIRVSISDFDYEKRAGEEGDTYISMTLMEYRAYGARIIAVPSPVLAAAIAVVTPQAIARPAAPARSTDSKPVVGTTVKTKQGDTIASLATKYKTELAAVSQVSIGVALKAIGIPFAGLGGATAIYDANKAKLANRPKLKEGVSVILPKDKSYLREAVQRLK